LFNVGIIKTPQNNVGMKTKSHQNSVGIMQNTTQCRNEKHNTMLEWKTQHNLTLCCGVFHYSYIVLWCFCFHSYIVLCFFHYSYIVLCCLKHHSTM
jgi:hypothetical protein